MGVTRSVSTLQTPRRNEARKKRNSRFSEGWLLTQLEGHRIFETSTSTEWNSLDEHLLDLDRHGDWFMGGRGGNLKRNLGKGRKKKVGSMGSGLSQCRTRCGFITANKRKRKEGDIHPWGWSVRSLSDSLRRKTWEKSPKSLVPRKIFLEGP